MVCAAVRELRGGDIKNTLSRAPGNDMDEAKYVLARIPEAHAAAHATFKVGSGTAHVERDHALVLVPDVDHPVDLFIAGLGVEVRKKPVPVCAQGFVDDTGGREFFILRVFDVAEAEEKLLLLTGPQTNLELHRADRRPAVRNGTRAAAILNGFGKRGRAVYADKRVSRGIEAVIRTVRPEDGIVIPALAVLGFVVDGIRLELDLADGEVSLEVRAVVHRVPEAELYIWEHIERLFRGSFVFQRQPDEQAAVALRDQQRLCS